MIVMTIVVGRIRLNDKLPRHVAIIMDGNGRWALEQGLLRVKGHQAGADVVKTIIKCCLKRQIPMLSLFAFSSENWSRPEDEIIFLMQLLLEALSNEVQQLHQHGVCIQFTGFLDKLSLTLQQQIQQAQALTLNNNALILNVVINYGGRWDIVNAAQQLARKVAQGHLTVEAIDEHLFSRMLSTSNLPDPDLFIRTSGEQRISNFFLWQLAYTELYFTQVHWPDFTADEFEKALESFSQRERRYGKTSAQLKSVPADEVCHV